MKRLAILTCLLMGGCAANVSHELETSKSTGIRYYESAPYLLVYSNGKGGLSWQVLYLPDQTHVMVASPQLLGGRTQMALKFQNGVLTSATTTGDSTVVPKAIIAAIQSALPIIAKGALESPPEQTFPAPSIYKLIVKDGKINFVGGKGDKDVVVPLNTGASS